MYNDYIHAPLSLQTFEPSGPYSEVAPLLNCVLQPWTFRFLKFILQPYCCNRVFNNGWLDMWLSLNTPEAKF